MKAIYRVRKAWRSEVYLTKQFNGVVRIGEKRVLLGSTSDALKFDKTTGVSQDAFNPHVRRWTLLQVIGDDGAVVLTTQAGDEHAADVAALAGDTHGRQDEPEHGQRIKGQRK